MASVVKDGAYAYFKVLRPLDTGDADDFLVQVGKEFDGGWAAHSETSNEASKHNLSGAFFTTMNELVKVEAKPTKKSKEE